MNAWFTHNLFNYFACMLVCLYVLGLQHSTCKFWSFWERYDCFSYECDTLFRCPTCLCSRVSGGAHLVFLFPRESLERTRLKFSLQGGKVTALCLQEGEQVWALNIKRALLSMLQTSRISSKQELEKEVRVDEGYVVHNTIPACKTQHLHRFHGDFKIKQVRNKNNYLCSSLTNTTSTCFEQ